MAFAFDEAWIYGGQLSSSRRNVVPEGLGKGDDKVTHSLYIQGPSQFGTNTSYSGNKGGVEATVMIAQKWIIHVENVYQKSSLEKMEQVTNHASTSRNIHPLMALVVVTYC